MKTTIIKKYFPLIAVLLLAWTVACSQTQNKDQGKTEAQPAAGSNWPKEIMSNTTRILIYQPQTDSLVGNKLYSRAAVSVTKQGSDPVFGAIWALTTISTNRETREVTLVDARILNVRFPNQDQTDPAKISQFTGLLETEIPKWQLNLSMDDLLASLKDNQSAIKQAENLNNTPPEIIFSKQSSILVIFDGNPSFKQAGNSGLQGAINTPFLVLQDPADKQYYLYGGDYWFRTNDVVKGKWVNVQQPPKEIQKYQQDMTKQSDNQQSTTTPNSQQAKQTQQATGKAPAVPVVIVRTKPAELIQTEGEPSFAPIQGTQLLYVTNTDDDIFMTIDKQSYYILLSGRWYSSANLTGPWTFIASDNLPPDFAKIPEGSDKDIVLASVAGTDASKDAILDAQIPQTAAVDRKTATCKVTYDGEPKFEQIKGTLLYRAVNTGSTVIMSGTTYYVCDNAVWFTGNSPNGPWAVATSIPEDIQKIPPDDPAYNVKYVYIYDVQPDVIYMGYLPGYVGCYVYGPTIVYGTGWGYPCWYGPYFYPRPVTWGFSMHYNPWTGWSMGFGVSYGMFSFSMGPGFHGGWWGPPVFRPPFYVPYNHYYGHGPMYVRNTTINVNNVNVNRNNFQQNNIYNNKPGTRPVDRPSNPTAPSSRDKVTPGTQPSGKPQGGQGDRGNVNNRPGTAKDTKNNVYTDRDGNVYKKDGNNWQKNDGKNWQPADSKQTPAGKPQTQPSPKQTPPSNFNRQSLDSQSQSRDRGTQMNTNHGNFNRGAGGGGGGMRGGRR